MELVRNRPELRERSSLFLAREDLKAPEVWGEGKLEMLEFFRDLRTMWFPSRGEPQLVEFCRAFMNQCDNEMIPIYVRDIEGEGCYILHAVYGEVLTPQHWQVLRIIGDDVAYTHGLHVAQMGSHPYAWHIRDPKRVSEKAKREEQGLVISPVSGIVQSLAERVVEARGREEPYPWEITDRANLMDWDAYATDDEQAKGSGQDTS